MENEAVKMIEALRKLEESDTIEWTYQADEVRSTRIRLEKLETMYRTAINECHAHLETVGVRL